MKLIEESRTRSTSLLAKTIAKLTNKPESFIVSSAVGWYGDRGDEELDESSDAGQGFLQLLVLNGKKLAKQQEMLV